MRPRTGKFAAAILLSVFFLCAASLPARGDFVYEVDLTGFETFGGFLHPDNSLASIEWFPNAKISKVEWIGLEFTTDNGSYLQDFVIFVSSSGPFENFWADRPDPNSAFSGTYTGSGEFTTSTPFYGGPFSLLSDGILRIGTYQEFAVDDVLNATVTSGTLRITAVPEPSTLLYVGSSLGVWFGLRKRKSKKASSANPISC